MPQSTRADWVNPLDKIEQLLTCAICLDRYRTPKLLPCQHTFCMEPCMDGLVDPVRRLLKCPECRAEHPLPYDGVKAFQTNYTLMGFLEIHLESTSETADEFEAYVRRFNMERCRQCNEKAEVDFCAHCEKKICDDCKTSHVEMLKRDLTRLMNQVKRIATRISEASTSLTKGLGGLETNVATVKEEIQDYVNRHTKELKKREDVLMTELEAFSAAEIRMMRSLKENLDLESSNINEACTTIESCVKGDKELTDEELTRFKRMFTEGLDYLRLFNPDSEDFAIKKVRFQPGQDPQILPHAIAQFGELHVCTTHFNKYQGLDVFVPRFGSLALESDNTNSRRPSWDPSDPGWLRREADGSSEKRYDRLNRTRANNDSESGSRYSRGTTGTTSRYGQDGSRQSLRPPGMQFQNSPWNRPSSATSNGDAESPVAASPVPDATEEAQVPLDLPESKRLAAARIAGVQEDEDLNRRVENIRNRYESRRHLIDLGGDSERDLTAVEPRRVASDDQPSAAAATPRVAVTATVGPIKSAIPRAIASSTSSEDSDEPSGEEAADQAHTPIPVMVYPTTKEVKDSADRKGRSDRYAPKDEIGVDWKKYLIPDDDDNSSSRRARGRVSSRYSDIAEKRQKFVRSRTNPDLYSSSASSTNTSVDEEKPPTSSRYSGGDIGGTSYSGRRRFEVMRTDSNSATDLTRVGLTSEYTSGTGSYGDSKITGSTSGSRYKRKTERSQSGPYSGPYSALSEPETPTRSTRTDSISSRHGRDALINGSAAKEEGRHRSVPKINYIEKGRAICKFGSKGSQESQFNWPRGITVVPVTDEIAICDSSNHRVQIFDHRGVFQKTFGTYGSGKGEFDCLAGICINKYKQFIITDRYNHRVQIFDSNGRFMREFGSQGQTNGKFNSPWGVAVDTQGFIYICDKDNHRVQIFQADGNFAGKFGGLGSAEGHFHSPHFIASNKSNQLIVTDCSNHRVQVFDHNGHFLFQFGTEGFGEGQFKYPRGVAVDHQGYIVVADSGNNRIQIFHPDGRFYCAFGCWGTGDGQMKQVEGVALAPNGRIVASDRENHRIQVF